MDFGGRLRAYERTGAEGQIAGSDAQREMSPTDGARAFAPVTCHEIGATLLSPGSPHSEVSGERSKLADALGRRFVWHFSVL